MCDENCDYNKVNIRLECAIKRLSPKTLSENELDTCPQVGRKFNGTEKEVVDELEPYQRLLDSRIIKDVTKEKKEKLRN